MGRPRSPLSDGRARLRFVLRYLALAVALLALPQLGSCAGSLRPLDRFLAGASSLTLNALGEQTTRRGVLVLSPRNQIAIVEDCNGYALAVLVGAGVLAFPTGWRARGAGLVRVVGVVFALNFLRILGVYYLGAVDEAWAELFHYYVAPLLIVVAGSVAWLRWTLATLPRRAG